MIIRSERTVRFRHQNRESVLASIEARHFRETELKDSNTRVALTSAEARKWAAIIEDEMQWLSVREFEREL